MRITLVLIALLTGFGAMAQSQNDMNIEARDKFMKADKELNDVYKAILVAYKEDTVFIKSLRATQVVWIKFRDSELKMKYPPRPAGWYGSIQPWCESTYLEELTRERIKKLNLWLAGVADGDSCAGSIK